MVSCVMGVLVLASGSPSSEVQMCLDGGSSSEHKDGGTVGIAMGKSVPVGGCCAGLQVIRM